MDTKQKVAPLTIEAEKYQPELDLREANAYAWRKHAKGEWSVSISATGIEAERRLNLHDITAIRDWCNEVLAAEGKGE